MSLTRRGRWYHALAPVGASVECGGELHRVAWQRGKLSLADHDLGAERTMLVFGGEPCTCLRVLEMWRQQFGMPPEAFAQMDTWLGENAFLAPAELAPVRELAMVLGWERAWRKSAFLHRKQARLLGDELTHRALRPLRDHLNHFRREVGARMVSQVEVAVVPSDQQPTLEGTVEGISMRAKARLNGRWVVDVWGRGLAVVSGAFVVGVVRARSADDLDVTAVRWRGHGSAAYPVAGRARATRAVDGPWQLEWLDDVLPEAQRGPGPERPSERGPGPERPSERGPGPERPSERGPGPERPSERGPGPERPSEREPSR